MMSKLTTILNLADYITPMLQYVSANDNLSITGQSYLWDLLFSYSEIHKQCSPYRA